MYYKKKYRKFFIQIFLFILFLNSVFLILTFNKLKLEKFNQFDKFDRNLYSSSYYTWDSNVTLNVGEEPSSIFIGDVNNDGENDIVTANQYDDTISILTWNLTTNNWTLYDTKPVGEEPSSVFIADANNDGENDIVVANSYSDNISIYLWDIKIGTWQNEIKKSVGGDPRSVFVGDVNNDGENDIVTANYDDDNISIFTWNSTLESWNPEIKKSVGDRPNSVFIGDADNDGQNDIVVTQDWSNVSIYTWNVTENTWNPEINIRIWNSPTSVFIGDANNDGYNDMLIGRDPDSAISILLWNATENTWNDGISKIVANSPSSVFIGDANNDGLNDIVVANEWHGYDIISILLWNYTASNWKPRIEKIVGDSPSCVFVGDANNDGQNDIVCSNYYSDDISILLWNNTKTIWASSFEKDVGDNPYNVLVEDINNDGYNDIITSHSNEYFLTYYLWNQSIRDWNPKNQLYIGYDTEFLDVGDVNNDGFNDFITTNSLNEYVSIFLWNKTLTSWNPEITKIVGKVYYINSLSIGDANNDGQNDIVTTDGNDENVSILLWNTTISNWNPYITEVVEYGACSVVIKDANNDGYNDILTANLLDYSISVITWNSTEEEWNDQILIPTAIQPSFIYIDDANNDGQNDIIAGSENYNISIFLWNGESETWETAIHKRIGFSLRNVFIGDANNDGQNDIVCSGNYYNNISILLWNSTEYDWNPPINMSVGNAPWKVIIGDANNDGFNDLIISKGTNDASVSIILWPRIDQPNLNTILPNPSGKQVQFNWTDVNAPFYNIYRSNSTINSVKGMKPIAKISSTIFSNKFSISGNYSYVITASDGFTESLISNCESVSVDVDPPTWDNLSAPDVSINSEIEISIEVEDVTGIKSVLIFVDATDFPAFPNNISMEKGIGNIFRYKFNVTIEGAREFRIYIEDNVGNIEIVNGNFNAKGTTLNDTFPYDLLTYLILILSCITVGSIISISIGRQRKITKRIKQKEQLIEKLKNNQNNITEGDIILSRTEQICLVHKGPIEGFNYICPHCKVSYCSKCYTAIKQIENMCWSCSQPLDPKKPIKPSIQDTGKLDGKKKKKIKRDKYKKTF